MPRVLLLGVLLCVSPVACSSGTPGVCASNSDCPGGEVCLGTGCAKVCADDTTCGAGLVCDAGVCQAGGRSLPRIDAIDSGGSLDGDSTHASHHLDNRLIIDGANFAGVAVSLVGTAGAPLTTTVCERTDSRLVVELPSSLAAGAYSLTLTNQAGSCGATVPLLQGEAGPSGPTGPLPAVALGGMMLGDGTSLDPLRLDSAAMLAAVESTTVPGVLAQLSGSERACGDGGRQRFDGVAWGACVGAADYCDTPSRPGCSVASASTSCKTLKANAAFLGGDGIYFVDPDGAGGGGAFEVFCDMTTAGGGWSRAMFLWAPASSCNLGPAASSDPRLPTDCAKLSDAAINQLASDKTFFSRVAGHAPLFTKYTGTISTTSNTQGLVVHAESYAAVSAAAATYTPAYSGYISFSQHNWYQGDTTLGSEANSCRLSLEYISTAGQPKYACCAADCAAAANQRLIQGTLEVFVR